MFTGVLIFDKQERLTIKLIGGAMIEAADLKRLNYPAESIDIKECPNCNKEINIAIYFHHVIAIDFTCCNLTQTYSAFQQRSVKDNIYGGPL